MSDSISREAVLNKIEEIDKLSEAGKTDEALALMKECFESLSPSSEWISVKDGLPNGNCACWITLEYIKTGNRVLYESYYDLELETFYNQKYLERKGYKLIAWQKKRMPSPYTGE